MQGDNTAAINKTQTVDSHDSHKTRSVIWSVGGCMTSLFNHAMH